MGQGSEGIDNLAGMAEEEAEDLYRGFTRLDDWQRMQYRRALTSVPKVRPISKKQELKGRSMGVQGLWLRMRVAGVINELIPVQSLYAASKRFEAIRNEYGFASSEMLEGCGRVTAFDGKTVANISYNGRIWDPDGKEILV